MSTYIAVNVRDCVNIETDEKSRWATVTEVHTAGVTVRHTDGTLRTYLYSAVLDVEPSRR